MDHGYSKYSRISCPHFVDAFGCDSADCGGQRGVLSKIFSYDLYRFKPEYFGRRGGAAVWGYRFASQGMENPRYIIPILGMLLGNTMNSGVISLRNLEQSIKSQRKIIEQKLSYGAKPTEAVLKYIREAYKLALLPHISSMAGMGVVSLPGMMTGQVLSGTDVMTAVKYQIAIVLGITAVAAVSNYILLHYAHKKYFNPREQMLGVESGKKSN